MASKKLHGHYCDELSKGEEVLYDPNSKTWAPYFHGVEQDVDSKFCHKCGEELPKNLKVFHVHVPEVWWQTYEVVAEDKQEAIDKVNSMDRNAETLGDPEYSRRLEKDKWEAEEIG